MCIQLEKDNLHVIYLVQNCRSGQSEDEGAYLTGASDMAFVLLALVPLI